MPDVSAAANAPQALPVWQYIIAAVYLVGSLAYGKRRLALKDEQIRQRDGHISQLRDQVSALQGQAPEAVLLRLRATKELYEEEVSRHKRGAETLKADLSRLRRDADRTKSRLGEESDRSMFLRTACYQATVAGLVAAYFLLILRELVTVYSLLSIYADTKAQMPLGAPLPGELHKALREPTEYILGKCEQLYGKLQSFEASEGIERLAKSISEFSDEEFEDVPDSRQLRDVHATLSTIQAMLTDALNPGDTDSPA